MNSEPVTLSPAIYCPSARELLDELAAALREVIRLQEQQIKAVMEGDPDSDRFDDLIHVANQKKKSAKYAYLDHLSLHGCFRAEVQAS